MFIRKKPIPSRRRTTSSPDATPISPAQQIPPSTFRRNQTLSSYRRGDDESSIRKQNRELNQLRRRLFAIFAIFATTSILTLALLSQYVSRVEVTARDIDLTDSSIYIDIIDTYYNANFLERFRFFLRKDSLLAHLQTHHPEIERIASTSSRGIFTSTITFDLVFRTPVAVWTILDQNYYVDGTGRAFMVNYHPAPPLTIIDENHIVGIQLGETAIASNRFLEFVGRLITDLALLDLTIERAQIPLGMSRQLDIWIVGYGYQFKLAVDRSSAEQAEDIYRLIRYLSTSDLNPSYLDIRTRGRAYFQ